MGPSGPMPGLKEFRVAGHFYSGMYEFDSKLAYVALAEAQAFLRMPGEVTGIDVRTDDPRARAAHRGRHPGQALGTGYEAQSWEELNKGLFMALRLEKIAMFVVLTFIALVASFSIVSTLIMMATEKAREVAILKAMGAEDGAVQRVFVAEGLYIGLIGLVRRACSPAWLAACSSSATACPCPSDVYYITQLPVVMRTGEIAIVAASALGCASWPPSIPPSWRRACGRSTACDTSEDGIGRVDSREARRYGAGRDGFVPSAARTRPTARAAAARIWS